MLRLLPSLFALALIASSAWAQNDPCDPAVVLPTSDPAYSEAMKLSKTISERGIQVRCVLLSKEARMFNGQLGAAFFRTDIGDFEALFLPPTQSWDKLKVIEQQEDGEYEYRFKGCPTFSGTWEQKVPLSFVKHHNQFLHSLDPQVISKLRKTLQPRRATVS